MRFPKTFAWFSLAVGLALPGASTVMAQDWGARDVYHDRQDLRYDRRDLRFDYANVDRLRADIARDRWRLDQNIRAGRSAAAAEDARDLARDQRALDALLRDIRRDRADMYYDRRDLGHDYRGYWRYR